MTDTSLSDGLRRYQNQFNDDLSFRDISDDLQRYLTRAEFLEIRTLPETTQYEKELKIDKLFFTFIYIKRNVQQLIDCLRPSYDWICEAIERANRNDKWLQDYLKAIHDIPDNHEWNVHRTSYLWEIQRQLKRLQKGQYLILFGKLGFGKRWLAA